MRLLWLLRKWWKRMLCRLRLITIIEYCDRCGVRQPLVWYSDDGLWFVVTGQRGGVLCPRHFDEAALRRGILLRWWPYVDGKCPDQTAEGSRVEQKR
ncbi:MAG TPA: hypothetical protein VNA25_16810 [Phycisphaerae bacterium]|nr:hypothetical protein [Phycisphaerae bacterium]